MATFRAIVQGNKGEASRLGHREISACVNGWNLGVSVHGFRDNDGKVTFQVSKTGGSNGGWNEVIATVKE